MAQKIVVVNPVFTTPAALKVAQATADVFIRKLSENGSAKKVKLFHVESLAEGIFGQKGQYTANEKNRAILAFHRKNPVSYIISFKVDDGTRKGEIDSSTNSGAYVEYNRKASQSDAMDLYNQVYVAWHKNLLFVYERNVIPEREITDINNPGTLYRVEGNRHALDSKPIVHRGTLGSMVKEIEAELYKLADNKTITGEQASAALDEVKKVVEGFKKGLLTDRLSNLVVDAIESKTDDSIHGPAIERIRGIAASYGRASSLFIKTEKAEYLPSLTLVLGNLRNSIEALVLQSEDAFLNHAVGAGRFVLKVLGRD